MILSEAISLVKERLKPIYSKEEIEAIAIGLCSHYFGTSSIDFYVNKDLELKDIQVGSFISALDKLQQHCPLQYVIGETLFYGLTFKVDKSVLIPRPETEELVDWICNDYRYSSSLNILDIGTGSGAIAISLAHTLSFASVTAIDISETALKIAQANANLNNVSVRFLKEDIFSLSPVFTGQAFDIIVSNPPYVRESEKQFMNANVLNYEPSSALFVPDNDPLKYYRAIADFAAQHLKKNGTIYLEINEALADETTALFSEKEYAVTLRKDLSGKNRMLKISKL